MVECNLAKVEVAGSNPVSRSIFPLDVLELPGENLPLSGESGNNLAKFVLIEGPKGLDLNVAQRS